MDNARSKKIAKNTIFVYSRMILIVLIGLYTSRIVLQQLGAVDFGIFNVVGGLVTMFAIISNAIASSTTRFLTFDMADEVTDRLRRVFSTCLTINHILAVAIIIVAEVVGVWFLNSKLNIPPDRLFAAHVVLQCSILSFAVSLITSTYHGLIVAHEKMDFYAYMGFIEVIFKCIIAFGLTISSGDKLILYSVLSLLQYTLLLVGYIIFCHKNFKESRYRLYLDKQLSKEILSFTSWNLVGSSSRILRAQGVNVVINIFCGPLVNAARGISFQVFTMVTQFNSGFMSATQPQIIKLYAEDARESFFNLVQRSSKMSFFLLLILSTPILLQCPFVLDVWLDEVPEHTVLFVQLMLVFALVDSFSFALYYAVEATGQVKSYHLFVSTIQLLNVPISYLLLSNGYIPESAIIVYSVLTIICLFPTISILQKLTGFPAVHFLIHVVFRSIITGLLCMSIPAIIAYYSPDSFIGFIFVGASTVIWGGMIILLVGCNRSEREFILGYVQKLKNKVLRS